MAGMNKAFVFGFYLCCTLLLLSFSQQAVAQEPVPSTTDSATDTISYEDPLPPVPITEHDNIADMPVEMVDTAYMGPMPGKAAFYSAVLPGLGQAYNDSHWKIPLIYIGGAIIGWTINNNHKQYSFFRQNLQLIVRDPSVSTVFYAGQERELAYWDRRVLYYRRNRDYMIIIGGVLYMLNIVEAYVDAHLQDFNVSDDLAIRIKPALMAGPGGNTGAGIALTLNIK